MQITCQSVDDFITCLRADPNVYQKTIRKNVVKRQAGKVELSSKAEVVLQLTAVICLDDGEGQYLLQMGAVMGVDYMDGKKEHEGSDTLGVEMKKIEALAVEMDLRILPGVIGV